MSYGLTPDIPINVHRNILDLQRACRVKQLGEQIATDFTAGYDVDHLLDERAALVELIATGPHA